MAGRPKGIPKTGGRKKGTSNKVTLDMREKMKAIIDGEIENIQPALDKVRKDNPVQYVGLVEKLMAYVMPKKKDITSDDKPLQIVPISGVKIIEDGADKQPTTETS